MDVNKAMEHERIENVEAMPDKGHRRPRDEDDASSIRSEALGDDIPKGYFHSVNFLGALTVRSLLDDLQNVSRPDISQGFCLSAISAYIFLLMPTNIL